MTKPSSPTWRWCSTASIATVRTNLPRSRGRLRSGAANDSPMSERSCRADSSCLSLLTGEVGSRPAIPFSRLGGTVGGGPWAIGIVRNCLPTAHRSRPQSQSSSMLQSSSRGRRANARPASHAAPGTNPPSRPPAFRRHRCRERSSSPACWPRAGLQPHGDVGPGECAAGRRRTGQPAARRLGGPGYDCDGGARREHLTGNDGGDRHPRDQFSAGLGHAHERKAPLPGAECPRCLPDAARVVQVRSGIPGRAKITIAKASQKPPRAARPESWWLELEKRMGATLDITLVPLPQFTEKATALIAGGDIPDILLISPLTCPTSTARCRMGVHGSDVRASAADALKALPEPGAVPRLGLEELRRARQALGRAAPRPRHRPGPSLPAGLGGEGRRPAQPKNADDFLAPLTAMTKNDPDGNGKPDTWGLGAQGGDWSMPFIQRHVPRPERLAKERRRHARRTRSRRRSTSRRSLSRARCYEAGVYHPDAGTTNRTQATNALIAGQIGGYADR